jgi:hypothetical protein
MSVRLSEGDAHAVNYQINGHTYSKGYYLADNIYPSYAIFLKTISNPHSEKKAYFSMFQEL